MQFRDVLSQLEGTSDMVPRIISSLSLPKTHTTDFQRLQALLNEASLQTMRQVVPTHKQLRMLPASKTTAYLAWNLSCRRNILLLALN